MLPWKRYSLPEPCAAKAARTVLRGRGDSNVVLLPGGRRVIKGVPSVSRRIREKSAHG